MRTTSKIAAGIAASALILLIGLGLALSLTARAEVNPSNFFKRVSGYLLPVSSGDKIGSSTVSATFNNLTISGTCTGCTAGGTISLSSGGTLTITGSPISLGGGGTAELNLANSNTWTALQKFANASTSQLTATSSVFLATVNGSVGIGTTSPRSSLFISSSGSNFTTFTSANSGMLTLYDTTSTGNPYQAIDFDNVQGGSIRAYARIGGHLTGNGSQIQFGTSNSFASGVTNTALTLDYNGFVGIGTSSPYSALQVTGGASATTTVTIGSIGLTSSKGCVNINRSDGGAGSFYLNGAGTIVSEPNYCK